jgi:3',5'-cyclic AMP phosphodiesterase CpdA
LKMFRIAHLSDIHFGDENPAALNAATNWLGREAVDLIVISGDLTRYATLAEFEAAAAWLAGLPHPWLVTPGNHDTPYVGLLERAIAPFGRFQKFIGPAAAQSWRGAGVAVRGVNTARGLQLRLNWSKGAISQRQARETADWFQADDTLRIVVAHHPLIEMIGGPMSARVRGGTRAAGRLVDAKVDLVLSGHVHAPFVWPYPDGDGKTYAVGAGTLSVRERGVPPGFNLIETDAHQIRITALGWSGSTYAPSRSWAMDRRESA